MKRYIEKNRQTLKKAVGQLPEYAAPERLWSEIAAGLDQQQEWRAAIRQLPVYSPPDRIWDQIDRELNRHSQKTSLVRRLRALPYRQLAAAVVTGLLIAGWWSVARVDEPVKTSISYSEEVQMPSATVSDWGEDDQVMSMVMQEADQSPIAERDIIQRLKSEFRELTDARTEVEEMLKRYGRNEDLLREIARIERARSLVVKELAASI